MEEKCNIFNELLIVDIGISWTYMIKYKKLVIQRLQYLTYLNIK